MEGLTEEKFGGKSCLKTETSGIMGSESDGCKNNAKDSLLYGFGVYLGHYLKVLLISIGVLYISILSLLFIFKDFRSQVLFLNWFNLPLFANFSTPEKYGLHNTINLYFQGDHGKIGAWYATPINSKENTETPMYILYLHGNGGSRALRHRVALVKKLQHKGCYVLVVDYRGFGDSDGFPSEEGLISDASIAWNWLLKKAGSNPSYIWGHSLGSGVTVALAKRISSDSSPNGIILEAPFNNVRDAAVFNPFTLPVRFVPHEWLHSLLQEMVEAFPSDLSIQVVKCPIFIAHDVSDDIIPVHLAEKLCSAAKTSGRDVTCEIFDEKLYHKSIHTSSTFFNKLRLFLHSTRVRKIIA